MDGRADPVVPIRADPVVPIVVYRDAVVAILVVHGRPANRVRSRHRVERRPTELSRLVTVAFSIAGRGIMAALISTIATQRGTIRSHMAAPVAHEEGEPG
jgi:hypothetical protein